MERDGDRSYPVPHGRSKSLADRQSLEVREKLDALGCDPIEGLAQIAMGRVPCVACEATGIFRDRQCTFCYGTGVEVVPIEIRSSVYAQLAKYVAPTFKSIEVRAPEGIDVRVGLVGQLLAILGKELD